jgi:hypothetical protein
MPRPRWSTKWLFLAALPAVVVMGAAAFVFMRAQHSLDRAGVEVARDGRFPVELRTVGRPENPGFEAIASPDRYASGAFYQGKLYVSGPSGLFVYGGGNGVGSRLLKGYRVGLDLPAAPLGAMAVGRLRGASEPELMIATRGEGVLVFSGNGNADGAGSFRQIRAKDVEARDVTALLPLPTGELLIGTQRRGLLVYRGAAELETFHPQLANLAVTALAGDATGFWMGTRNHGVRHWHAGQIDSFEGDGQSPSGSLPDSQVDAIAVRGNKVYAATPLGVEEFDDGRPARVLAKNVFAHALFADAAGLTIGTEDEGIRRVSLNVEHRPGRVLAGFSPSREGSTEPAEQFLPVDSDHIENGPSALFAVMRDGVRREQPDGRWAPLVSDTVENKAVQLTDDNISALAFDADGRLWVGYFDHGMDILSPTDNGSALHREDDHLFCINRIVLDPRRQTMAVATANGLVLFDRQGKPRQVMTRRDGLIADHVTDVAFTANSAVIATPAGLTFMDGSGARSLYAFQGLVNNHVYALGVRQGDGRASEMLAGTLGGVSVLDREAVKRNLTVSNSGLKHNWVTAIVPVNGSGGSGPDAGWMVGTYGAGVMRLDKDGRFTPMDGVTRSMVVNPNAMMVTSNHVLAGTLSDGLLVWSRTSGRWRQVTAGLPSENITALAEHEGEIYVGTENGLVRIAEHLLD